ncbi:MAG: glutamate-5-semialdehyde dehydrogenase [Pseudomonadota bacterium]
MSTSAGQMLAMGRAARLAMQRLQQSDGAMRAAAIVHIATALRSAQAQILTANALDVAAASAAGLSAAMIDRLTLDAMRIDAMAAALDDIAGLPDPLGRVLESRARPNGLQIERISVPLGVIGIIYESRPNVTADAAAICLKAGNSVILRGGSESARSSQAIVGIVRSALSESGLPQDAVQMVPSQDRELVGELLSGLDGQLDVLVPRGGRSLVERVQREARVPVIGHLEGLCHVYVHAAADAQMATDIVVNAKMRRTGICGAAETLLLDAQLPDTTMERILDALHSAGCALRGCSRTRARHPDVTPAEDSDWSCEYLDSIISIKIVDGIDDAIEHIRRYGSGHTESIVTADHAVAEQFLATLDSAIVMHNASTQFADGGEFGMGAEIGISTSRIHARGPVGANELTSYKYVVLGSGQLRA